MDHDKTDERIEGGETPKDKGKDLDALRARLGLKDAKKTGAQTRPSTEDTGSGADPQKISTDDFKLDFGAGGKVTESVSMDDLDTGKVTKPKGLFLVVSIVAIIGFGAALWLGMQFGRDLGLRSLHNAGVTQAKTLKTYFFEPQTDPTGQKLAARVEAIQKFRDEYLVWYNDNINALGNLIPVLETGDPTMLAQLAEYQKVEKQLELVKPLIKMLEKVDTGVADMSPHGIFGDRVFHPEIAYKVVDYMAAANRLRRALDDLRDNLTLLYGFQWSPEPPTGIKTELVIWAPRKEGQEDIKGALVEMSGEPEEKKKVEDKFTYQTFKEMFGQDLDIKVPKCEEVPEGEEQFDSYVVEQILADIIKEAEIKGFVLAPQVHLKITEQEVKRWHEVKVKRYLDETGDKKVANLGDLVQLNIRPVMEPMVAQLYAQYSVEMLNRAVIFAEIVETLDRIKDLTMAASPENLETFLEELAKQETYATF
ncbi:MAG: hypothetical protein ABIK09_02570 [Pseudomonadota bacterium]